MKKIICKRVYDTETASLIKKYVCGKWGDPSGYEESLYQTPDGLYFIHVCGGEASTYQKEEIIRIGKARVAEWLESH